MFSPKIILWSGVASTFGGLFWLLAWISANGQVSLGLALVLGLGGLVGLYSRQVGQGGKLGLAGFALGIIGTGLALAGLLGISSSSVNLEIDPVSAAPAVLISSLGMVILGVGLGVLGVTSLRANTLHRWRGLPLGLGLLSVINGMMFLVFYVPLSQGRNAWDLWIPGVYVLFLAVFVLLGLGWMGLGITLAAKANSEIMPSPPASA